jgi:hypothetical protein
VRIVDFLRTFSCLSSFDELKVFRRRHSESVKVSAVDAALYARDVGPKSSPISKLA